MGQGIIIRAFKLFLWQTLAAKSVTLVDIVSTVVL